MAKKPASSAAIFRRIALSMPETVESSHMGHPDFRVPQIKGRIFASLFCSHIDLTDEDRGMVKLTPEQQEAVIESAPTTFSPIKGTWGLRGCTQVDLSRRVNIAIMTDAIAQAWANAAPRKLVATRPDDLSHPGKGRGPR